jgi:hypothetical protein
MAFLHSSCVAEHGSEAGQKLESADPGTLLAALTHNFEVAG